MNEAGGRVVAILNHNRVMAYMVSAEAYEAMLERLDEMALVQIVQARTDEKPVIVDKL